MEIKINAGRSLVSEAGNDDSEAFIDAVEKHRLFPAAARQTLYQVADAKTLQEAMIMLSVPLVRHTIILLLEAYDASGADVSEALSEEGLTYRQIRQLARLNLI